MDKFFDFLMVHFWSIAGSILLACFVAWLGYRTVYRGRHAAACGVFRTAILAELGSIHPIATEWPQNIDAFLQERFPRLQIAVSSFRPFVPWWQRWRFDDAWFRYHCSTGRRIDANVYHHYMGFYSEGTQREATAKSEALFHKNVKHLLSFASET